MTEWKECKLGDFIKIKHGYAFEGKSISFDDNNIVLVTPVNFAIGGGFQEKKCKFFTSEYPEEYVLQTDDLIVTMTDLSKDGDTLGYSAKVPFSDNRIYLHNQRIGLVQFKNDSIDKEYVYWYMRSPIYQKTVLSTSSGSTVKHTSPDRICNISIPVPSLEIQKKIATILSSLDKKIELNNKINDNLEKQAQSLFKQTFATKIENVTDSNGLPLGNIVEIIDNRGKTPPSTPERNQFPILDVGALNSSGRIINYKNCTKFVDEQTYKTFFRDGHPQENDILLSTVGSLAQMKFFKGSIGCIAQNVVAFRTPKISPTYLYEYLKFIRNDLLAYDIGSVQPSIKVTHIIKHLIYIPTDKELSSFDSFSKSITEQIYNNVCENERLISVRDILLPKLMSGEIDVDSVQF